jgi:hypothetical protein
MERQEPQYQSYLLRLWCSDEGRAWRVMLECVGTHERYGFSNLEDLCAFLEKQMSGEVRVPNIHMGEKECPLK